MKPIENTYVAMDKGWIRTNSNTHTQSQSHSQRHSQCFDIAHDDSFESADLLGIFRRIIEN